MEFCSSVAVNCLGVMDAANGVSFFSGSPKEGQGKYKKLVLVQYTNPIKSRWQAFLSGDRCGGVDVARTHQRNEALSNTSAQGLTIG